MRIVYLLDENLESHLGLHEKVHAQLSAWRERGHECFLANSAEGVLVGAGGEILLHRANVKIPSREVGRLDKLLRLRARYLFVKSVLEMLRPEITYSRYLFPIPGPQKYFLATTKLIFEVNSDDRAEYFLKHRSTGFYNTIFRKGLLASADGLVFVTGELAESDSFALNAVKKIVIGNGVNVSDLPYVATPNNASPQICFIGSPQHAWHGVDKLMHLVDGCPDCVFHVIGPTESECLGLWQGKKFDNVKFHGYLPSNTAVALMAGMDLGVSSLALHRNGMDEACPLKTRQYLSMGLPIITAYLDPDVASSLEFVLTLPNREDNVRSELPRIRRFIQSVFGNTEIRNKVRQHAAAKLDVEKKEGERLAFFEKLLMLS